MNSTNRILWLIMAVACLALALGCKSRDPYTGRYQAEVQEPTPRTIILELKANGEGSWTVEGQEVQFRWEVKDDQIWLHTKGGGVIIGYPVGNMLFIDLSGDIRPTGKKLQFKRLPEGG